MSQTYNTDSAEEIKKKKRADYSRAWRLKNLEKCREINRKAVERFRKSKPDRYYAIQRKYDLENLDKRNVKSRRYQIKFPIKLKAQSLVNQAINRGELVRKPCQHCQNPKTEAHHCDYSKPLDVQWLCKKHHVAWHKLFIAVGGE